MGVMWYGFLGILCKYSVFVLKVRNIEFREFVFFIMSDNKYVLRLEEDIILFFRVVCCKYNFEEWFMRRVIKVLYFWYIY